MGLEFDHVSKEVYGDLNEYHTALFLQRQISVPLPFWKKWMSRIFPPLLSTCQEKAREGKAGKDVKKKPPKSKEKAANGNRRPADYYILDSNPRVWRNENKKKSDTQF